MSAILAWGACALAVSAGAAPAPKPAPAASRKAPAAKPAAPKPAAAAKAPDRLLVFDTCLRVIEGDLIEGKKVGLVRLIGVIAPAKGEPGYREAIDATRRLTIGKQIKLEICPERANDTQDRVRAIVFLPDGTNLNTKLLRLGMARVLDRKPCHIGVSGWHAYEESARKAKLGLWSTGPARREGTRPRRPSGSARVNIRPAR